MPNDFQRAWTEGKQPDNMHLDRHEGQKCLITLYHHKPVWLYVAQRLFLLLLQRALRCLRDDRFELRDVMSIVL